VILVDLRERVDSPRIFAMMRPAVETDRGRLALGIGPAGEVAAKSRVPTRVMSA
jgi:hypothetical protein